MANTLKFGNGQWATGNGTALAYNDENANFKPLPFDFTRASSGTVVNQSGLIETVGSGIPRIDFQDNAKGALLLEPQRSNLIPYSQDFSNAAWEYQNVTINSNQIIAPDGTLTADKITDNSTNSAHRITDGNTTSSSGSFTYSIFLKKGTLTTAQIQVFNSGTASSANVDLVNGTITSGGLGVNHTIQNYGNDWFKCSISGTLSNTATTVYLYLKQKPSYIGNGDYLYAWGVQLEEGSYATSYIRTSGSAVTRVADGCIQTVPDGVIGQTEETIYFESTINGLQGGDMRFQLSDGSTNNWIFLSPGEATGIGVKARAYINNGNVNQFNSYSEYLSEGKHKYALAFNLNDIAFYVDGVQVALDNSATIPSCDEITLSGNTPTSVNTPHFLSYKDTKLYNTRLSNAELAALTTI